MKQFFLEIAEILFVPAFLILNISLAIGIGGLHRHNQHQIIWGIPGFVYMAAYIVIVARLVWSFNKRNHSES